MKAARGLCPGSHHAVWITVEFWWWPVESQASSIQFSVIVYPVEYPFGVWELPWEWRQTSLWPCILYHCVNHWTGHGHRNHRRFIWRTTRREGKCHVILCYSRHHTICTHNSGRPRKTWRITVLSAVFHDTSLIMLDQRCVLMEVGSFIYVWHW